jgi:hypothetical protein
MAGHHPAFIKNELKAFQIEPGGCSLQGRQSGAANGKKLGDG